MSIPTSYLRPEVSIFSSSCPFFTIFGGWSSLPSICATLAFGGRGARFMVEIEGVLAKMHGKYDRMRVAYHAVFAYLTVFEALISLISIEISLNSLDSGTISCVSRRAPLILVSIIRRLGPQIGL